MNENSENGNRRSLSKIIWILLFAIGFIILLAVIIPTGVGNGGQKANAIINNLRYIDGAKNEWALEHGITNADQVTHFNQPLTWADLGPYLLQDINVIQSKRFDNNGVVHPASGEIYTINSLNKPPEVKLPHDVEFLSKGTIIPDPDRAYVYLNQTTNN
jgi:hypothetical protein